MYMNYGLNSLQRGCVGDDIGDYYGGYQGGFEDSLSSYAEFSLGLCTAQQS